MKKFAALALFALATPAAHAAERPITDRDPDAMDVAKTPVTDLNIDKEEIPEILIEAERQPYSVRNAANCQQIVLRVTELDRILGPDLDLPEQERSRISAGRVAKTVVSSFIPFRGLIREVSGANDHERRVQAAVQAGLARRGFLKGLGQSRNCAYPGRPASEQMVLKKAAERDARKSRKKGTAPRIEAERGYMSEPVVQDEN